MNMKDLSKNVKLYCNICGNDQFESIDEAFVNLKEAPETVKIDIKASMDKGNIIL